MTKRTRVYEALDSERAYQIFKWGIDESNTVGDFLIYMQDYLTQAMNDITRNIGDDKALDTIRKVTALGVACLEEHGVQPRKGF